MEDAFERKRKNWNSISKRIRTGRIEGMSGWRDDNKISRDFSIEHVYHANAQQATSGIFNKIWPLNKPSGIAAERSRAKISLIDSAQVYSRAGALNRSHGKRLAVWRKLVLFICSTYSLCQCDCENGNHRHWPRQQQNRNTQWKAQLTAIISNVRSGDFARKAINKEKCFGKRYDFQLEFEREIRFNISVCKWLIVL